MPPTPPIPSQVLEGGWAILGIPVVLLVERQLRAYDRDGRGIALLFALAWWLCGRSVVALTWRDDHVVGPLGAEGMATVAALAGIVISIAFVWRTSPSVPAAHQTVPVGHGPTGTGGR